MMRAMSGYYDPGSGNSNWGNFNPENRDAAPQWTPVPLTLGFSRLGRVVRLALRLLAVLLVVQIALYVWGLSMFEEAAASGDLDQLRMYDDIDATTSTIGLILLLTAGITWMVWQQRLAKSAQPNELRRRPGWHAWAWITPVVGLWFPYQNVLDLWRRRFPERGTALLGWWWAAFLASNLLDRIIVATVDQTDTIDKLETLVRVELASNLVSLLALVMAVQIHRSLSDAEAWRFRQPFTPQASPAG